MKSIHEKYLIKKGKTDMISSLKQLNEKVLKESLKNFDADTIEELAESAISEFEFLLDVSKDDIFTRMYFQRLLEHENTIFFSVYDDDIESFLAFVYEKNDSYSYYIPDEIKKIIKKVLDL